MLFLYTLYVIYPKELINVHVHNASRKIIDFMRGKAVMYCLINLITCFHAFFNCAISFPYSVTIRFIPSALATRGKCQRHKLLQ